MGWSVYPILLQFSSPAWTKTDSLHLIAPPGRGRSAPPAGRESGFSTPGGSSGTRVARAKKPGDFRDDVIIEAISLTDNRRLLCWQRSE